MLSVGKTHTEGVFFTDGKVHDFLLEIQMLLSP